MIPIPARTVPFGVAAAPIPTAVVRFLPWTVAVETGAAPIGLAEAAERSGAAAVSAWTVAIPAWTVAMAA